MTESTQHPDILTNLRKRIEQERFRQVYCNRDLNMERVAWVGFDMDYTLAIYRRVPFDELAHNLTLERLVRDCAYPAELLAIPFDPDFAIRGLVVDRQTGHILKIDSHRYVGTGTHGLRSLEGNELDIYKRTPPNLSSPRFGLVDTLFELPEAYLYAAVVQEIEALGVAPNYSKISADIRAIIDSIHADGSLKGEVTRDLDTYMYPDAELALTLHRFRSAGKKLFLMTNSYADYTDTVMTYMLGGQHPDYPTWKTYFDVIITGATKPSFFRASTPFLKLNETNQVVGEERDRLERGVVYQHGNFADFERMIGAGGDAILYVGDHIYGDILRSKRDSAWRTAMIIPELEAEQRSSWSARELIQRWSIVEDELQRMTDAISFEADLVEQLASENSDAVLNLSPEDRAELDDTLRHVNRNADRLRRRRRELIESSRAIERELNSRYHPRWGPLMKEGNEHSVFGQQVEQYACLYTSRVANFLYYSPMHYFRSPRDLLPHEYSLRPSPVSPT